MIPILLYHQVAHLSPEQDPKGLAVTPEAFEAQMAYLHRSGFRCISLQEAVAHYQQGKPTPSQTIVITFDDGFRDLYTTIQPIMARYGFTATVFFVAGCAGRMSDWQGQDGPLAAPLMNWDEVRKLQASGFTIASHTTSHTALTSLDTDAAREELTQSKTILEAELGQPVRYFSFPYSEQTLQLHALVKACGYDAACGGEQGAWSMHNLWRTQIVASDTTRTFSLKAKGYYQQIIRIRQNTLMRSLFRGPWRAVRQMIQAR